MKNLDALSDEQLLAYVQGNVPKYRKILAKVRSFYTALFGKLKFTSLAGDVTIDVSELGTTSVKVGSKLRLSNYKAPSFQKMKTNIAILHDTDALDELTYSVERLESSSSTKIKAQAKQLRVILDGMIDTYNAALDVLDGLANKHLPQEAGDVFASAQRAVNTLFTSREGKKVDVESSMLIGSEKDAIDFCQYFYLEELTGQKLVLIVTCSLSPVGSEFVMSRHVTTQNRIQPPFNFDTGPSVTDVKYAITEELAMHDIMAQVAKVTLNVDSKRITNAISKIPGVVDLEIGTDTIRVNVTSRRQQQYKDIFAALVSDTDVKKTLGRKFRLNGEYDADTTSWVFSVVSR
jgi:hypothetical protein